MLIENGTLVTGEGSAPGDLLIEGDRIVAIGGHGAFGAMCTGSGCERLDAAGCYVMPGGVDVHTHMEMRFGSVRSADTFETGTKAAALGGTTTIVDFAIQARGQSLQESLNAWQAKAAGRCSVDYGFHLIISEVSAGILKEMESLVDQGVTSFKLFMAYPGVYLLDDGEIFSVMQAAAAAKALVMLHAENGLVIDVLAAQAVAGGNTAPRFHGTTRPPELEAEATHRGIALADLAGAPVYFVHLSASGALGEVTAARDRGAAVFAETCPHYLFLDETEMDRPGFEGAKFVCSPPLRRPGNADVLWEGLRRGDLSVVATDHCPFCMAGQKEVGVDDFRSIPNGVPGIEHRLDLLYQGVRAERLSIERWCEIVSVAPAKLFGLYPAKGSLLPDSDADVVVYDPNRAHVLSARTHNMAVDYSIYEGTEVVGAVRDVLLRGKRVVTGGTFTGVAGDGRFVARSRWRSGT